MTPIAKPNRGDALPQEHDAMTATTAGWIAARLAAAPPLTDAQTSRLGALFRSFPVQHAEVQTAA